MITTAATLRILLKYHQNLADVYEEQHTYIEGNTVYLQVLTQSDVVHLHVIYMFNS